MFEKSMSIIDRFTASKIAECMNCWAGQENRMQIITANEVLNLTPVSTYESKTGGEGCLVYAYQWGDVTILARVFNDGHVRVQHVCW